MKKLLFSFIAILMIGLTSVNAQGFKGKWFVLGEVGYGTKSDGDIQNYSFLPVVGTFVAPTTAIGLGIGYIGDTNKAVENTKLTNGLFIIQPLARKYWPVTDNFLIFGQAAVPLAFGKTTTEVGDVKTDTKFNSYGIQLAPGIDYFLSSHFTIEASIGVLGWTANKPKDGDAVNSFDIGLNSGFQNGLKIGLKYVF